MPDHNNWFESWFDSPYYHLLYRNRNDDEAQQFIDTLVNYLSPKADSRFLDLACGSGRHSKYLASKGVDVTGIDLSENSIAEAAKYETDNLEFYIHDMRHLFRINYYHYVLNLFTSFGYFDREQDNIQVLKAVHKGLQPKGVLVIDFLNYNKVADTLVKEETKTMDYLQFHIRRSITAGHIVKDISFEDDGDLHEYQERVQALTLDDFKKYFNQTGFALMDTFGDYALEPYQPESSDRLILIAQKL